MSGFVSSLRPYQQEAVNRTDSRPLEDTMTKSNIPHAVAAFAAVATTLVIFSSVVSLAAEDKAALASAQVKPTTIAQVVDRLQH